MHIKSGSICLNMLGDTDIHDITSEVVRILAETGLKSGTATIFCPSSTSALTTIEFEPGALADLRRLLDELVPSNREYSHNATWDDSNGFSHMRASLLGPSITIPFVDGRLTLGTWQQIIFMDFDIRPRHRELVVQITGE